MENEKELKLNRKQAIFLNIYFSESLRLELEYVWKRNGEVESWAEFLSKIEPGSYFAELIVVKNKLLEFIRSEGEVENE